MIISKTPLRASFFGGGSDFAEYYEHSRLGFGSTISTTLQQHIYITVNRSFDDSIRLCYAGNELVHTLDQVKHNLIREAMRLTGVTNGVEIFYSGDIPLKTTGFGLASSSALCVGVLGALHALQGHYAPPEQLAREACHIERDLLGQHIGVQDQYAVAYGGFNVYRFAPGGQVSVAPVLCGSLTRATLQASLMLFYTGSGRDSSKILSEQESGIEEQMDMLDDMVKMVDQAVTALAEGHPESWGKLLDQAWSRKKRFAAGVSNHKIDEMYAKARQAGALGGKILGAGGGGFLLLYVPERKQDEVRHELAAFRELPIGLSAQGSHIVFSD